MASNSDDEYMIAPERLLKSFAEYVARHEGKALHIYAGYAPPAGALLLKLQATGLRVALLPWLRNNPVGLQDIERANDRYRIFRGQEPGVYVHIAREFRENAKNRATANDKWLVVSTQNGVRGLEIVGASNLPVPLFDLFRGFAEDRGFTLLHDFDNRARSVADIASPNISPLPKKSNKQAVGGTRGVSGISIFISYRRRDNPDTAGRIYDRLVSEFGRKAVFKDVDTIPPGVDFRIHLQSAVSRASIMLVVIGPQWRGRGGQKKRLDDAGDFVRIEILEALSRQIHVVPVLIAGGKMPSEEQLPSEMRDFAYLNAIQVRPDPDFHIDADRLIRSIRRLHNEGWARS